MCADFLRLREELDSLEQAGADWIHWDVMDGVFVPNLTFGAHLVNQARAFSSLPFDVHLMVSKPELIVEQLNLRAEDVITFHVEACSNPAPVFAGLRAKGVRAGIALNPDRPVEHVLQPVVLEQADLICVMGVFAGFAGQRFIPDTLERLEQVSGHPRVKEREILVEVDGGVNDENVADLVQRGAQVIVSGSFVFSGDYAQRITQLRRATSER